MNSTIFSIKRAFLRTVRFSNGVLTPLGLTPARFDLMFVVGRTYRLQGEIHPMLGVSPPTVSRMLRSLERLEIIERWPDPLDWRRLVVQLTDTGLALLDHICRAFLDSGSARLVVAHAIGAPRRGGHLADVVVLNFEEVLLKVRRAFCDTANLVYVFDPDEWRPPRARD